MCPGGAAAPHTVRALRLDDLKRRPPPQPRFRPCGLQLSSRMRVRVRVSPTPTRREAPTGPPPWASAQSSQRAACRWVPSGAARRARPRLRPAAAGGSRASRTIRCPSPKACPPRDGSRTARGSPPVRARSCRPGRRRRATVTHGPNG
eukprot:scaffold11740_cov53-Phaeocystis_antarctica.AAC.2